MKQIKYLYFSSMLFMGAISISACTDMLTEKPENTYEKDGYFIREENFRGKQFSDAGSAPEIPVQ